MEKISRILPPSKRVTLADTESSHSVRTGAPFFSRKKEIPDINDSYDSNLDRITISKKGLDRMNEQLTDNNLTFDEIKSKEVNSKELNLKDFNPVSYTKDLAQLKNQFPQEK